MYDISLPRL